MYSKYDITVAKWGDVKTISNYSMAILPWGATEPHNYHLPYCTDLLTAQAVAFDVAQKVAERGVNLMVLPGIPLGSQNPGQVELPFCIHTRTSTQYAIIKDIVDSLKKQGINKLVIMSGHGGNIFKGIIRDLMIEDPSFTICQIEWFAIVPAKDYFEEKLDDHAGELETSVMMYYYPHLVDISMAGDGTPKDFAIEGFNKKVAWIPRDWSKISTDTGVGYPKKANAQKGERYINAVLPKICDFIQDFDKKSIY